MDTDIDLTGNSQVDIRWRDESGNITTVSGAAGTPSNGIITWTTTDEFFDAVGFWRLEGVATFGSGVFYGDPAVIKVAGDLNG